MHVSNRPDAKTHSDFKGVSKCCKRYVSFITINNKKVHIGIYKNEIKAALAYNDAAIKKDGLAARINTVPVPKLECVGDCEWRLGPHYFTKEDLGEDMNI